MWYSILIFMTRKIYCRDVWLWRRRKKKSVLILSWRRSIFIDDKWLKENIMRRRNMKKSGDMLKKAVKEGEIWAAWLFTIRIINEEESDLTSEVNDSDSIRWEMIFNVRYSLAIRQEAKGVTCPVEKWESSCRLPMMKRWWYDMTIQPPVMMAIRWPTIIHACLISNENNAVMIPGYSTILYCLDILNVINGVKMIAKNERKFENDWKSEESIEMIPIFSAW